MKHDLALLVKIVGIVSTHLRHSKPQLSTSTSLAANAAELGAADAAASKASRNTGLGLTGSTGGLGNQRRKYLYRGWHLLEHCFILVLNNLRKPDSY